MMDIFVEFIDGLPVNNQIAVGQMLNELPEDDAGFIEDYLIHGKNVPSNIINRIDKVFEDVGFPQFNWGNCQKEFYSGRFGFD